MKNALLIIVPAIAILALLTQIDDELSDEATGLINRIEVDGASDSYLYLSGIFANEKEHPEDIGRKILEEYRKLEADDSYEVIEYPESEKIPLPSGDVFCSAWEDGCIETLFSSDIDINSLFGKHEVLVYRSNQFLDFGEYKTLSKPTANEQFPSYQYIVAAERIRVVEAITTYKNGHPQEAIQSLLAQLSKLRKAMELQDNLIGKLVFLSKLSEIMDVSSIILSREGFKVEKIPGLSRAEKDFSMVAAREFGMVYHSFRDLDRHPEFFELQGAFPGWITRMVYKPNMTVNAVTPIYSRLERLAQLPPSEFAKEIDDGVDISLSTSKFRNYAGNVLIGVSPDFAEYVGRFADFEAKLVLFNNMHHYEDESAHLKNPYYEDESAEVLDEMICFKGPMEDKRLLRCLRVKI